MGEMRAGETRGKMKAMKKPKCSLVLAPPELAPEPCRGRKDGLAQVQFRENHSLSSCLCSLVHVHTLHNYRGRKHVFISSLSLNAVQHTSPMSLHNYALE
jgi:hypothetical protein